MLAAGEERLRRVCRLIGLKPPPLASTLAVAASVALLATLVSLAVAQPVLARPQATNGRTDAEVFFVFDISGSMAARATRNGPTRLQRARAAAKEIRSGIGDVPAGIASLTDRVLPHLFPSISINAFNAVVDDGIGVNRPPARLPWGNARGTALGAVGDLGSSGYFSPSARRRAVVVLTDGETVDQELPSLASRLASAGIKPFLVRIWGADERVYFPDGTINAFYTPDPSSGDQFAAIANALQTRVYSDRDTAALTAALRRSLGQGPHGARGRELQSLPLAPLFAGLAFLPLLYLLYRRNLPALREASA